MQKPHNCNNITPAFNKVLVIKLLNSINKNILNVKDRDYLITYWCNKIDMMIKNHGVYYTIIRLKHIRLLTTKFLSGQPMFTNNYNIATNKHGLPRELGPLQELALSKSHIEIRLLMTLLILSRIIKGGHRDPDLSSIVNPSPFIGMDNNLRKEISLSLKSLGIKDTIDDSNLLSKPKYEDFHPTTKSGPNGQALLTSINDAHGIYEHKELKDSLCELSGSTLL